VLYIYNFLDTYNVPKDSAAVVQVSIVIIMMMIIVRNNNDTCGEHVKRRNHITDNDCMEAIVQNLYTRIWVYNVVGRRRKKCSLPTRRASLAALLFSGCQPRPRNIDVLLPLNICSIIPLGRFLLFYFFFLFLQRFCLCSSLLRLNSRQKSRARTRSYRNAAVCVYIHISVCIHIRVRTI
jgi:hypothetical protein